MAVTLLQLSAALRLGDGETAPPAAISGLIERLLGVSQAFVQIAAPDAPAAIADQATIQMTATLYDQPTSTSGDRYAAAWRNSGAEALVSRWVVRRAGSEGEGVPVVAPSTGGLDDEQVTAIVESLLGEHADQETVHHTPPTDGGGGTQDVVDHNAANDSHEDIRTSIDGRVTQAQVEETANRLINASGHATNTDVTAANDAIQRNADALVTHEGTPHGGGNGGGADQTARDAAAVAQTTADDAQTDIDDHEANHPGGGGTPTPTPPTVLVDGAPYTAHGDVTVAGWRDYDFAQLYYAVGGNTYMTPPVNTVQLIAFTSLIVPIGRNVEWTLSIDAAADDVINTAQSSSGNAVAAPTATSTMTVIAWRG